MIIKILVMILSVTVLLGLTGCDKSQEQADKYSHQIAIKIAVIKGEDEFYQPSKSHVAEFLKNNEDEISIESIEIIQISEGVVSISINGKIGKAQYQTPVEYKLEKEKRIKTLTKGPVIKRFFLGMSPDSVFTVINSTFPEKEKKKYVRDKNFIYFKSGTEGNMYISSDDIDLVGILGKEKSYFFFNDEDKLTEFCIGTTDIDYLFKSGLMSLDKFAQNFIDSYDFIDKIKPYNSTDKESMGYGNLFPITVYLKGYNHESNYGWELKILDTPIVYMVDAAVVDSHRNIAGAVILTKKKSKEEIKFGD